MSKMVPPQQAFGAGAGAGAGAPRSHRFCPEPEHPLFPEPGATLEPEPPKKFAAPKPCTPVEKKCTLSDFF